MPTKILQVLLSPRVGGAETLVASLTAEWTSLGFECETVYLDRRTDERGGKINRLLRLKRDVQRLKPDLVVAHSYLPNLYARLTTPRRTKLLAVLHSASDDYQALSAKLIEKFLLARHSQVIAVSAAQAESYARHFKAKADLRVIPNGVRLRSSPKACHSPQPSKIVSLARLAPQKNVQLWIDVCAASRGDGAPLFEWWGPALDSNYHQFVTDLIDPLSDFPGTLKGPTKAPWEVLRNADIYLHTADREAHSISILEAAAMGLPIVCSNEVSRTLPQGLAWRTFNSGDSVSATAAINETRLHWEEATLHATSWVDQITTAYSMSACARSYLISSGLLGSDGAS